MRQRVVALLMSTPRSASARAAIPSPCFSERLAGVRREALDHRFL
jgi:hypothetical protein